MDNEKMYRNLSNENKQKLVELLAHEYVNLNPTVNETNRDQAYTYYVNKFNNVETAADFFKGQPESYNEYATMVRSAENEYDKEMKKKHRKK